MIMRVKSTPKRLRIRSLKPIDGFEEEEVWHIRTHFDYNGEVIGREYIAILLNDDEVYIHVKDVDGTFQWYSLFDLLGHSFNYFILDKPLQLHQIQPLRNVNSMVTLVSLLINHAFVQLLM